MKEEIWRDVPNYEHLYEVSNLGNVRSLNKFVKTRGNGRRLIVGRVLKNLCGSGGYYHVSLYKECKQEIISIHRLIAKVFLPNPNNYPVINHIDSNRKNNDLSNLEWCTQKHNLQHARDCGRLNYDSQKIKIKSFNPISGEFVYYNSINSVKKYGFTPSLVCYCAKGIIKSKTHKGLIWDYV